MPDTTTTASTFNVYTQNQYSSTSSVSFNPTISGPPINYIGTATVGGSTGTVQMSAFSIFDGATGTNGSGYTGTYFKASGTFMLLSSILDTAPAAVGSSTSFPQQLTMTYNVPNYSSYTPVFVQLTLSAGGRVAVSPVFQTTTTSTGQILVILTNYFQISMPGIIYTVTIEGSYIQNSTFT
jgi:hypothetical protein